MDSGPLRHVNARYEHPWLSMDFQSTNHQRLLEEPGAADFETPLPVVWSMVGERERDSARTTATRHRMPRRATMPPQVLGPGSG
jgi:hypothetical protein